MSQLLITKVDKNVFGFWGVIIQRLTEKHRDKIFCFAFLFQLCAFCVNLP